MSWAEIVKTSSSNKTKSQPITVRYNNENTPLQTSTPNDPIPRHREITPHPADDCTV